MELELSSAISLASISDSVIEESNHRVEAKRKLKRDMTDIGVRSSLHGLGRMITRRVTLKIIWAMFFLGSFGLCVYTIVTNVQQFLTYGVNTLVQVVPQDKLFLPTISVCNLNHFITQQSFEYIADYYTTTYNVTLTNYTQFYGLVSSNTIPNDIDWLFYKSFDPQFNRTLRNSFGFSFEQQDVWCRLLYHDCRRWEFKSFYHPRYGNCFTFNTGYMDNLTKVDLEFQTAEEYGLEMGIFAGLSDTKIPYFYSEPEKGIVIIIGDQGENQLDQDGISIKAGSYANVALSKATSEKLPSPYNDCKDPQSINTKLANEMRRLNITYNRQNCFTLCKQMRVIQKLGCYDMRYPNLFNSTPCNDKTSYKRLKNIDLVLETCKLECPFECATITYAWDISYSLFPNYYSYKLINMTMNNSLQTLYSTNESYSYSDLQQAIAAFFVYFDPMTIVQITQAPSMPIADLIANMGGNLGLFLGVSLLSLVEFLEMAVISLETFFRIKFSRPLQPKKPKPIARRRESNQSERDVLLKEKLFNELKRTGFTTTLHGVPNILFSNRLYVKILWLLFTLASMSVCIFMIFRAISNYLQFGLTSQIRQVPQDTIKFPSIQICNPNFFATREAAAYLQDYYLKYENVSINSTDDYLQHTNETFFRSFSWPFYKTFSPSFNSTLRRSLGHSLEDTILTCRFNSKPCDLRWFQWFYHPLFGNCYRFNTGYLNGVPNGIDILSVNQPNTGLYLELFTGLPDDYYNFYIREWEYNAVNLYISPQGHLPIDKYGRPFKPGSKATINMALSHYTNVPAPYSPCQNTETMNTDIVNGIRSAGYRYDRYNCIALCQQKAAYNASGCYFMSYPNVFNLHQCETFDECMKNRGSTINSLTCPQLCPAECEQYSYDYEVSYSDFPSQNYAYKLINDRYDHFTQLFQTTNITYDMFRKSVSSFFIYFDQMIVTEINESPAVEIVDLISNVGGILGLFVGLSILSFVEIVEFGLNIGRIIVKHKSTKIIE